MFTYTTNPAPKVTTHAHGINYTFKNGRTVPVYATRYDIDAQQIAQDWSARLNAAGKPADRAQMQADLTSAIYSVNGSCFGVHEVCHALAAEIMADFWPVEVVAEPMPAPVLYPMPAEKSQTLEAEAARVELELRARRAVLQVLTHNLQAHGSFPNKAGYHNALMNLGMSRTAAITATDDTSRAASFDDDAAQAEKEGDTTGASAARHHASRNRYRAELLISGMSETAATTEARSVYPLTPKAPKLSRQDQEAAEFLQSIRSRRALIATRLKEVRRVYRDHYPSETRSAHGLRSLLDLCPMSKETHPPRVTRAAFKARAAHLHQSANGYLMAMHRAEFCGQQDGYQMQADDARATAKLYSRAARMLTH